MPAALPGSHPADPSVSSLYEQRLRAAQPVRGGNAKQGWTISD
jgi:hypothetical protein